MSGGLQIPTLGFRPASNSANKAHQALLRNPGNLERYETASGRRRVSEETVGLTPRFDDGGYVAIPMGGRRIIESMPMVSGNRLGHWDKRH